ncbi:MAG: hypothetical protein M0Z32_07425 [Actinomycetota bacterium]|jgi:hypothetical protein|nr:hypothetical protein [Actinomycetota bacterium]MDA8167555.1 hypothetical protein [Actinomycetota bacterium]
MITTPSHVIGRAARMGRPSCSSDGRLLQKQSSKRNMKLAELSRVIIEASDLL